MTLRLRTTRRDWWPKARIPGLKRYGFIGDSTMYGFGVGAWETIPAIAEPLLNEALAGWPVETVNFGVSGYNLWNSWLGFKPLLPLFDGLVIALCNNDADMFDRTYGCKVAMPERFAHWEPDQAFGAAAAACFAAIGRDTQAVDMPVMVIFSSLFANIHIARVAEIIAAHCAANGLAYISNISLFTARKLSTDQLIVNKMDTHPSALAHEITARHMVAEMGRLGWFADAKTLALSAAPARLQAAAAAMIQSDDYPPDAALDWALRALAAKARAARRQAALKGYEDFEPAVAPARAALLADAMAWHVARRAEACTLELAWRQTSLSAQLMNLQTSRLRLEELGYALTEPAAHLALAALPATPAPPGATAPGEPPVFAPARDKLGAEQRAMARLCQDHPSAASRLAPLRRATALVAEELAAVATAVAAAVAALHIPAAALPPAPLENARNCILAEIATLAHRVPSIAAQACWAARLTTPPAGSSTQVNLVLRTSDLGDVKSALSLRIEYAVPHRMPFVVSKVFPTGTQPLALQFEAPLLYAGRITLFSTSAGADKKLEIIECLEFQLRNNPGVTCNLAPKDIQRDDAGGLSAPIVFLA